MRKSFFLDHQIVSLFASLGPNRCQPFDFSQSWIPFAKDASYQMWLKSAVVLEKSFKGKVYGWMTDETW